MIVEDAPVEKLFYQESEWRYVAKGPEIKPYTLRERFDVVEVRDGLNEATRQHCMLKVAPADIRYIFVRQDADIPDIINFIQTDLDHYPSADLKLLMSRVVSLESIKLDM